MLSLPGWACDCFLAPESERERYGGPSDKEILFRAWHLLKSAGDPLSIKLKNWACLGPELLLSC